jgi:hypothetical protein
MSTFLSTIAEGSRCHAEELAAVPSELGDLLVEAGLRDVRGWWQELDFDSRYQVFQLWKDCVAANEGQQIVACVEGEFIEEGSEPEEVWHSDFYEYLVNHEEFFVQERRFHVCTQHPLARSAIEAGGIPASFNCGLSESACPMRRLLAVAQGKAFRLKLGFHAKEDDSAHE